MRGQPHEPTIPDQGCGIKGFIPTSVIQGNLPLYMGGLVFGNPFLLYHRSGHYLILFLGDPKAAFPTTAVDSLLAALDATPPAAAVRRCSARPPAWTTPRSTCLRHSDSASCCWNRRSMSCQNGSRPVAINSRANWLPRYARSSSGG